MGFYLAQHSRAGIEVLIIINCCLREGDSNKGKTNVWIKQDVFRENQFRKD